MNIRKVASRSPPFLRNTNLRKGMNSYSTSLASFTAATDVLPVLRANSLDASRRQLVTQFVLGFFAPTGGMRRMPILDHVTRDEVHSVVLDTLLEYGRFPLHADIVAGDPPMYIDEQIRRLEDGSYLVANIEFYDHASTDGTSMRVFDTAPEAVAYFIRARVSNRMYGVPVL